MKHHYIIITIAAVLLLLNASLTVAFENNMATEQGVTSKVNPSQDVVKSHMEARRKRESNIKPVDINKATQMQLKTLPGVKDMEANKITAGRPYAYKQELLTRNIINKEVYDNIRRRIYVKPAGKSAAKNAANPARIKQ